MTLYLHILNLPQKVPKSKEKMDTSLATSKVATKFGKDHQHLVANLIFVITIDLSMIEWNDAVFRIVIFARD